jgi:hypothetical protein
MVCPVLRRNKIRQYFSVIERAPDGDESMGQHTNLPWTQPLKEVTIGEDNHCYLKRLRSSCYAFVPSPAIWVP